MSCALTSGFSIDCRDGIGGIVEFFLANKPTDFVQTQNPTGDITALSGTGLAFYRYEAEKNTAFVTETITNSRENGSSFVALAATYVLNGQSQARRNEIMLLSHAGVMVIGKDRNGNYKLYAPENLMTVGTAEVATGTAQGDRNGYTVNLVGEEPVLANKIDFAAFSAFIQ